MPHHSRAQYKRAAEGNAPAASLFYSYMPMFGSFPYSRRGAWVFGDHEHENDMKLRASLQSEELCPAQVVILRASFDTQLFLSSTVVYGCHLMMSTVGKRQKYQLFVVEKNLNKEQSKSVCSTPFFFRPTLHKPHTQLRRPFIIITPLCSALYFCCFNNVVDYNPKTDLESGGQKPKLD